MPRRLQVTNDPLFNTTNPFDISAESDSSPSPKRVAAEIMKSIPWSNGRLRIDPLSAPACDLSGVREGDADGNAAHSRSATPMLTDKALDFSGMDSQDKGNSSIMSTSSSTSAGAISCIGGLRQPEPFALSDNITSRRGSRGYHVN